MFDNSQKELPPSPAAATSGLFQSHTFHVRAEERESRPVVQGAGGARGGEGERRDKRGGCGSTDNFFSTQSGFLFQCVTLGENAPIRLGFSHTSV